MTLVDLFSVPAPASSAAAAPDASEGSGALFGALLALAGKTMDAGGSTSLVGGGQTATGQSAAGHTSEPDASEPDASETEAASPAAVLTALVWPLADTAGIVTAQAAGGRRPGAGDAEAGAQRAAGFVSTVDAVPTSTAAGAVRADATALADAAAARAPVGPAAGASAGADASAQPSDAQRSGGRPLGGWSVAAGSAAPAGPAALSAPGGAPTEAVGASISAASPYPAAVAAAGGAPASASPIPPAGGQPATPQAAGRPASASQESAPRTAPLPDQPGAAAASTPAVPTPAPAGPVATLGEAARRDLAAQVSPVVVSVAQRPAGSHRITMTVHPDTFGPVTVRAHISRTGDVQVELLGATDAGRDALRAVVADLRRDLAAALPHATLSLGSAAGSGAGAGTDAGPQTGRQHDEPSDAGARGDDERHPRTATPTAVVRGIPSASSFVAGAGLDILA